MPTRSLQSRKPPSANEGLLAGHLHPLGVDLTHVSTLQAMKLDGRAKYATSTPEWYALQIYFRYRTAKNLKDPLWLSARIVDKAIVISIAASLFFDQVVGLCIRHTGTCFRILLRWPAKRS